MDNETRRLIVAMVIALAVFLGYRLVVETFYPAPPAPVTQPAETTAVDRTPPPPIPDDPPPAASPVATAPVVAEALSAPTTTPSAASLAPGETDELITLGGDDAALRLTLHPRGAAVDGLWLTRRKENGRYEHRESFESEEPYRLLQSVPEASIEHRSYRTYQFWVDEIQEEGWRLDNFPWQVVSHDDHKAVFTTALRSPDGAELVRFTKTYELKPDKPVFDLRLAVENLSGQPLTVQIAQDGPLGVRKEHLQYDMRKLMVTQIEDGAITASSGFSHGGLLKATRAGEPKKLLDPEKGAFVWAVLCNKYFGVYTRPLPLSGEFQNYIAAVNGLVANTTTTENPGDLIARLVTAPIELAAGQSQAYAFEVYAGAKDVDHLKRVDPEYANQSTLYYQLAQSADARCCCTFLWLRDLMVWLLESIYVGVRNYGIAIMILVVIIRSLLHPLTVFQQKSMFRMQEAMGKLQPKMNAIKEKYANDRTRQNQEMMKLFAEENVNPAANFVSFIPMFLQMPILVALWTALNTDVNLRHAPFDGWWITDLSAPDAAFVFDPPLTIPILGQLPFIGQMFSGIPSLNILPVLMGVSMWLQQKYMPKPHMQAKLDAAKKERSEGAKPAGGMSPEDQMRQQQMIAYMMSIMFPLMFYYMPAGLNLYWMATNVFGICESILIRKQLEREKERKANQGPPPPKKPKKAGFISRFMQKMAAQAEELQRKADELAKAEEAKKKNKNKP